MISSLTEEVKENYNIEEETTSESLRKVSNAKDEELYRRYRTLMSDPILPNILIFDSNNNSFHDDDNNNFPQHVLLSLTPPAPLPPSGHYILTQQKKSSKNRMKI